MPQFRGYWPAIVDARTPDEPVEGGETWLSLRHNDDGYGRQNSDGGASSTSARALVLRRLLDLEERLDDEVIREADRRELAVSVQMERQLAGRGGDIAKRYAGGWVVEAQLELVRSWNPRGVDPHACAAADRKRGAGTAP